MIGLALRALSGGGDVGCMACCGCLLAIVAICGIKQCANCKMRDCGCIKGFLRTCGCDKFDDFEMLMVVHEAPAMHKNQRSYNDQKTYVRVVAGSHQVRTDPANNGVFQQPLAICVEQGTDMVRVELCNAGSEKALAVLKLDIEDDILKPKEPIQEQLFSMKQKDKDVLNPRVKLTIHPETSSDAEKGLLANIAAGASKETDLALKQQLAKAGVTANTTTGSDGKPLSEIDLLAKGCAGPVDMFGQWGGVDKVHIGVRCPPDVKKHSLGIWKDSAACLSGQQPETEVNILRIVSVNPDPQRADVFFVRYMAAKNLQQKMTFSRTDRARDVWVEMLQLLVQKIHDNREKKVQKEATEAAHKKRG